MVARPRMLPPGTLPIETSVPNLARICRMSRWRMVRRLAEDEVPVRRKGAGTLRKHHYVAFVDLQGTSIWDAIEWSMVGIRVPSTPEDEGDGDDD